MRPEIVIMSRLRAASFSGRWSHCSIVDSYNLYNRIHEYINHSPLLGDTSTCRTSSADLSCHLREAFDCLAGAFRTLGPRNVMVAFNGGKDATVVFHLFRACLAAHYVEVECQGQDVAELSVPAPGAVYFRCPDEFADMVTFAEEQTSDHGFVLTFQEHSVISEEVASALFSWHDKGDTFARCKVWSGFSGGYGARYADGGP